jgi:hypothetical protein
VNGLERLPGRTGAGACDKSCNEAASQRVYSIGLGSWHWGLDEVDDKVPDEGMNSGPEAGAGVVSVPGITGVVCAETWTVSRRFQEDGWGGEGRVPPRPNLGACSLAALLAKRMGRSGIRVESVPTRICGVRKSCAGGGGAGKTMRRWRCPNLVFRAD